MDPAQAVNVVLSAVGAVLFFVVGRTIQRRHVSAGARSAQSAFVLWWYGLGAVSVVGTVLALPGFPLHLMLFLVLTVLLLGVLCAALAGLLHYLVFLYTNRNLLAALATGYVAFFALLVAFVLNNHPDGLEQTPQGPQLHYATPITTGPLYLLVLALFILPPLAASLAYLSLYWKTDDRLLKRRILLVSMSIAVWFGSSVIGLAPSAQRATWWSITSHVISLAAAATILYAYRGLKPALPQDSGSKPAGSEASLYEGPQRRVAGVRSVRPFALPALV
jgi:small-conductance mechanosensitive channel